MKIGLGLLVALPLVAAVEDSSLEISTGSPVEVTFTDHVLFSNAKDPSDKNIDPINSLMHENKFRVGYEEYSQSITFANRWAPNRPSEETKPFVLEKKTFEADWESVQLKLGDSHQELGRGIALALFDNPAFGTNNTLEGAAVRLHPENVNVNIFGGRVNSLKAPVAITPDVNPIVDRTVYLGGGSFSLAAAKDFKLGTHYLFAASQPDGTSEFEQRWDALGVTLEKQMDNVDVYAESNVLFTQVRVDGSMQRVPNGTGSYASLAWSASPVKVKTEFKDFRQYVFEFRRPPRLDEDMVFQLNDTDITAAKLSAEGKVSDDGKSTVFGSYLVGDDREINSVIQHPVAGVRMPLTERSELEIKGGYRWAPFRNNLYHFGIKTKVKTFKGQSLEVGVRKQHENQKLDVVPLVEDRNIFEVTYVFNERFNVTGGYENRPTNSLDQGQHFANLGAVYKVGSLSTRGFVGQTGGGTQCSGGVCRLVPAYTGAYVDANYVF